MKKFFNRLRSYTLNLGLVEQAQIVASTAVVVIMLTIISANILLQKELKFLDFIGIVTVGIIGFASVYFSLKYGRQLEWRGDRQQSRRANPGRDARSPGCRP